MKCDHPALDNAQKSKNIKVSRK